MLQECQDTQKEGGMAIVMAQKDLYTLRIDAGFMTQSELAQAANLSISNVWRAENRRLITWKTARKIVNALRAQGMEVEIEDIDWNVKPTS
jgi:DNA-binding XRE family transcriptional regulator